MNQLDTLAEKSIQITTEALSEKDRIIEAWKASTLKLASRHQTCYICLQKAEDWMPKTLTCQPCHQKMTKLRCQGCYSYFSREELKAKEDYYWCKSCQPSAGFTEEEVNHA